VRIKVHELCQKSKAKLLNQLKDLKADLPSSASPRSPVVHPTSSSRCILFLSLVLFSKSKVFVYDIAVGIFWGISWVIQKGGEAVDCVSVDSDIIEAGGSEGSLQEDFEFNSCIFFMLCNFKLYWFHFFFFFFFFPLWLR
jgi:hypothetical protein